MTILVFVSVFLAYLSGLPGSLAPWRDTGEMTTAAWTLGVAHPTSYPLFVVIGRALRAVPLGNFAYRLNVLSAAAGAAAVALVFELARRKRGTFPALAAAAFLAFNAAFWTVSSVSEMYSLWILCAVALMAAAQAASEAEGERLWPAFCFLSGLLFGNRLDLVLWAPGLLWVALASRPAADYEGLWAGLAFIVFPAAAALSGSNLPFAGLIALTGLWLTRGPGMPRRVGVAAAAGLAGLSIYLYLPVRSSTGPLLDWNHPAALSNFLDSILRTRYGGTLDLISLNYKTGELFGDNLVRWGAHLWDAFGPAGLAAALAGCAVGFKEDRRRWLGRAACWWWSGPVFIFLANMPPNPHSMAILEPHYVLSDALLVFWAADGVAAFAGSSRVVAPAFAAAALLWPLWRGVPARETRRDHFDNYDFAHNVFRAAPPGAVVVAKKDVQLYALWHFQTVEGLRPDLKIVAAGLAGSPWYQAGWRRTDPDVAVSSLLLPEGWTALGAGGRPVVATQDVELPPAFAGGARERGIVLAVLPPNLAADARNWDLVTRRGRMLYDEAADFFSSDLIDEMSIASYRLGLYFQKAGRPAEAAVRFNDAWRMNWVFPEVPVFLGYMAAVAGRWDEAEGYGGLADELFVRKLTLADQYRALPELKAAIRRQAAENSTQHGVALEKLGRRGEAAALYRRSIALTPTSQAYYDLAVLAWGHDWAAAQEDLSESLRLDPSRADARRYLDELNRRASGSR